ncbi:MULTISPECIES: cyclic nucleotide-binding domain-containing protein [Rhizobium/Agrobacterium group]|jgi:CRP-like cAMP-binding protein|uniref:cyclic nucleotide-binding domain-containing protein n=1 Tax=Rhizobium/Agrobacterium group TaxID=227290 RepID=UPI00216878DD|nr:MULTISPECIES: cyclic nucleotide-binding domain-containing protein [Rhizobium/Agrobacterium group]MCS4244911.1 CRP-like cAMP-binding protein [Rhizobium sp. BIGb0125]MDO5893857.1 cyclic nucleotide-binding domain-containing protein [Agrobacterium sp. Azo12]
MALMDDIRLLSQVPLFAGLSEDQLRLIAFGAERRRVSTGQLLFRENSPAECAFLVIKGLFELSNMGRGGKPVLATRSGEGTLLSELALFTLCERKFTAVAAEDSEVIRITRTLFHRLVEEYPDVADMVIARIRDNLASLASGAAAMQHRFN